MPPASREHVIGFLKGTFLQWQGNDDWGFVARLREKGIMSIDDIENMIDERGVLVLRT